MSSHGGRMPGRGQKLVLRLVGGLFGGGAAFALRVLVAYLGTAGCPRAPGWYASAAVLLAAGYHRNATSYVY